MAEIWELFLDLGISADLFYILFGYSFVFCLTYIVYYIIISDGHGQ